MKMLIHGQFYFNLTHADLHAGHKGMAGQAPKMRAHLAVCPHVSASVRADFSQQAQARKSNSKQQVLQTKLRVQDLPPPPEDHSVFHRLLLRATLSANIAWPWVNNPEVQELFTFLDSKAAMPTGHALSGKILEQAVQEAQGKMLRGLNASASGMNSNS